MKSGRLKPIGPDAPCRSFNPPELTSRLERNLRYLASQAAKTAAASLDTDRLAAAVLRLQRGLTGTRQLVESNQDYMQDPGLLAAYLAYYWTVSYTQASYILAQLDYRPRRVLDVGAGPGPFSAAILDFCQGRLNETRSTTKPATDHSVLERLTLCDRSPAALALARILLTNPAQDSADRNQRHLPLPVIECQVLDLETNSLPNGSFDLIAFGHSLNEIAAGQPDAPERRLRLLELAVERLAPGGILIMLEPALLQTSRALIGLRDRLVDRGLELLGPCTTAASCPALQQGENQTCHEEFSWTMPPLVATLAAKAGLDRGRVKLCWFAFRRPALKAEGKAITAAKSTAKISVAAACSDNAPQPAPDESALYRMVSEAMLNKAGRVRYLLCGPAGRFAFSAKQDNSQAKAAGFFRLQRGDYLRISQPEQRENGWGFQASTVIAVVNGLA
ncbi:MAG TPA: hypothetical protein DD477_07825 [Spirochaetaceae bacterium]|nr:hypothetical protein [Spirochaetaceae bacterium]HBO41110.1 hypothetical protein [Spirochaetaceae bacterium]HCQ87401.1 hypothetical protein [Spirochaetaceae bacterium]